MIASTRPGFATPLTPSRTGLEAGAPGLGARRKVTPVHSTTGPGPGEATTEPPADEVPGSDGLELRIGELEGGGDR